MRIGHDYRDDNPVKDRLSERSTELDLNVWGGDWMVEIVKHDNISRHIDKQIKYGI